MLKRKLMPVWIMIMIRNSKPVLVGVENKIVEVDSSRKKKTSSVNLRICGDEELIGI